MYIISTTYLADLSVIESHLNEHLRWLLSHYEAKIFIASGRKQPWTGSVILASAVDRALLDEVLAEDPFAQAGLVRSEITEVAIGRTAAGLEQLGG